MKASHAMNTHHHSKVNALVNPVFDGDCIISESGERYFVRQTMSGQFWLQHSSGHHLTHPVEGQIGIVGQISELANI